MDIIKSIMLDVTRNELVALGITPSETIQEWLCNEPALRLLGEKGFSLGHLITVSRPDNRDAFIFQQSIGY